MTLSVEQVREVIVTTVRNYQPLSAIDGRPIQLDAERMFRDIHPQNYSSKYAFLANLEAASQAQVEEENARRSKSA